MECLVRTPSDAAIGFMQNWHHLGCLFPIAQSFSDLIIAKLNPHEPRCFQNVKILKAFFRSVLPGYRFYSLDEVELGEKIEC